MVMRDHTCGEARGFTLVELIIVIIVLGILAALAIPLFTTSTQDAKEATLKAQLALWRQVITRYYHEHDSTYPGYLMGDGSGVPTANPTQAQTVNRRQLKLHTNKIGGVSVTLDRANYPYGPYFPKGMPVNPINDKKEVKVVNLASPIDAGLIDDSTGWVYSKVTGELRANSPGYLAY